MLYRFEDSVQYLLPYDVTVPRGNQADSESAGEEGTHGDRIRKMHVHDIRASTANVIDQPEADGSRRDTEEGGEASDVDAVDDRMIATPTGVGHRNLKIDLITKFFTQCLEVRFHPPSVGVIKLPDLQDTQALVSLRRGHVGDEWPRRS